MCVRNPVRAWGGGDWGGGGALVQVFPGVAAALRLLMESAKRSIFLCQASISPWGYSGHFLLGTQGVGGA